MQRTRTVSKPSSKPSRKSSRSPHSTREHATSAKTSGAKREKKEPITIDRKREELPEEVAELLYQALETELGGVEVYRTALQCVQNSGLRKEWQKYLKQTESHVNEMREICLAYGLDPDTKSPGREIVHHIGTSLVTAMQMALDGPNPKAAEIVAAECVVLAETKDHLNWELMSMLSEDAEDQAGELLRAACKEIEEQEDEHLYHTAGWTRELWRKSIGLPAALPPPEEEEDVTSAAEAERAREKSEKKRKR